MEPRLLGQSPSPDKDWYLTAAIQNLQGFVGSINTYQLPPNMPPLAAQYMIGILTEIRNRAMTLLREIDPNSQDVTEVSQSHG